MAVSGVLVSSFFLIFISIKYFCGHLSADSAQIGIGLCLIYLLFFGALLLLQEDK